MSTNILKKLDAPNKKRARITNEQTIKFLTRAELAERWRSSKETIKRKQRAGLLHPIYLSSRKILYALAEIEGLE
jgi:flagellar biosynthesis/type III secretory pathway chaperone